MHNIVRVELWGSNGVVGFKYAILLSSRERDLSSRERDPYNKHIVTAFAGVSNIISRRLSYNKELTPEYRIN